METTARMKLYLELHQELEEEFDERVQDLKAEYEETLEAQEDAYEQRLEKMRQRKLVYKHSISCLLALLGDLRESAHGNPVLEEFLEANLLDFKQCSGCKELFKPVALSLGHPNCKKVNKL